MLGHQGFAMLYQQQISTDLSMRKIYVDQDADLLLVTSQEYHSRARKSLLLFKSVPQQSSVNKFDSV